MPVWRYIPRFLAGQSIQVGEEYQWDQTMFRTHNCLSDTPSSLANR